MKPQILFEDENFIIVNKPSGVLSIPDRHNDQIISVASSLNNHYGKLFIVHRIDKDTSGCLSFAKNETAHKYLSQLFENRKVEKIYLGIIHGCFDELEGTINKPIHEHPTIKGKMIIHTKVGKESITDYKVLESFGKYSLVQYQIKTGRTHQIRLHSADLGHPILCDGMYGLTNPVFISSFKKKYKLSQNILDENPILSRLALHARQLKFQDMNGNEINAIAELPKDMKAMLNQCRKWLTNKNNQ